MTEKELLYVEDALEHECYMKTCCPKTSSKISDITLSSYVKELEQKHNDLFNKFSGLL